MTVYRGAYGTCVAIPIRELVVGDIVDLQQGDRVPADCLLLEEMNMKVDQSLYGVTKERLVSKEKSFLYTDKHKEPDNHKEHPDPFLFADSKIFTGQGKAVVLCVGVNTLMARNRKPSDLVINE